MQIHKGHAENGESLEEIALREVREETGCTVDIVRRLSDVVYTHGKTGELIRVAMFEAKLINENDKGEEGIQVKWLPKLEAKEVLYHNLKFLVDEL